MIMRMRFLNKKFFTSEKARWMVFIGFAPGNAGVWAKFALAALFTRSIAAEYLDFVRRKNIKLTPVFLGLSSGVRGEAKKCAR